MVEFHYFNLVMIFMGCKLLHVIHFLFMLQLLSILIVNWQEKCGNNVLSWTRRHLV